MVVIEPSQFITDYRGFAIVTTVIFAVLGPLSILTGIPAVVAAYRVSWHAMQGSLDRPRQYWKAGREGHLGDKATIR